MHGRLAGLVVASAALAPVIWLTTDSPLAGRAPIIILDPPSGGGGTLSWSIDGTPVTEWGNSGELRADAFGSIATFILADAEDGYPQLSATRVTLLLSPTGGASHTLTIQRTSSNQFAWTLDGDPLVACDFAADNGVPDCAVGSAGLPPEFNGALTSILTVPDLGPPPGGGLTNVGEVRLQAQQ